MKRNRKNKELPNEQKRTRFRRWKSKKVWVYSAVALTMFGQLVSLHPVKGNASTIQGTPISGIGSPQSAKLTAVSGGADTVLFICSPAEMFSNTGWENSPRYILDIFNDSNDNYASRNIGDYIISDPDWKISVHDSSNGSSVTNHYASVDIIPGGTSLGRLNYFKNKTSAIFGIGYKVQNGSNGLGTGRVAVEIRIDKSIDTDHDGLSDYQEYIKGTYPVGEPWYSDTTYTTVSDTYAKVTDFDHDGLTDGVEVNTYGANPADDDSDDDGMHDGDEVTNGTDIKNPDADKDSDSDGLTNGDEVTKRTDLNNPDTDGDGLNDGDEVTNGTDPNNHDTDGDGMDDGAEVSMGRDPMNEETRNFTQVPTDLSFEDSTIPVTGEKIIHRQDSDWGLQVTDTYKKNFQVSVKETAPLTDGSGNQINNALIFKDANGEKTISDSATTTIYDNSATMNDTDHTIKWDKESGILMKVAPGQVSAAGTYSGELEFSIDDVPTATP